MAGQTHYDTEETEEMDRKNGTRRLSVHDMVYIALSAALITVCSWITVPAAVPFTMQTFAVFTVTALFGWKRGALSVMLYILLGAVGLPVFSGFGAGPAKLLGPTGGYIIGFLALSLVYGLLMAVLPRTFWAEIAALAVGCFICYAFGTVWFVSVYARTKGPIGFGAALGMCVVPFIPADAAKLALSAVLVRRLRRVLPDFRGNGLSE